MRGLYWVFWSDPVAVDGWVALSYDPIAILSVGIPHIAMRTSGFPLVLAACQAVFGEYAFPVRLIQAALRGPGRLTGTPSDTGTQKSAARTELW